MIRWNELNQDIYLFSALKLESDFCDIFWTFHDLWSVLLRTDQFFPFPAHIFWFRNERFASSHSIRDEPPIQNLQINNEYQ